MWTEWLLLGLMGHCVAEYVLQPEIVITWKTRKAVYWLAHHVVWLAVVASTLVASGFGMTIEGALALALGHAAIDTRGADILLRWLKLPSMDRSMRMAVDEEMPAIVTSVQFALSAFSEGAFRFTMHAGVIAAVVMFL